MVSTKVKGYEMLGLRKVSLSVELEYCHEVVVYLLLDKFVFVAMNEATRPLVV